ncbi:MAG: hypothetical protein SNH27_14580 [Rikenellaceae bacterium]
MEKDKSLYNTTETYTDWKITDNRFVAFLDIMGFKDMVMRKSHEEVLNDLEKLNSVKNKIKEIEDLGESIYITIFSDSVVVFSKDDTENVFIKFTNAVQILLAGSLVRGLPIKGSIAHGEISVNIGDSIFFGQPLIDAYALEEELCLYGVAFHNTTEKYLKDTRHFNDVRAKSFLNNYVYQDKLKLKHGDITHYNLNWYVQVPSYKEVYPSMNLDINVLLSNFYNTVSGAPRRYVDNTIEMYERYKKQKREVEEETKKVEVDNAK